MRFTVSPSLIWSVGPKKDGAYIIFLQVHHDCFHPVIELKQLVRLRIIQPVDAGHAVAHLQYGPDLLQLDAGMDSFQLLAQDGGDFTHFYLFCHTSSFLSVFE